MNAKDLLVQYATYSQWAHKRLLDMINSLSADQHHETVASSFNSLYKTVFHIWEAESLWFVRLNEKAAKAPGGSFDNSMKQLSSALELVDQQWIDWVLEKTDSQLTEKLQYTNKAGQTFYQAIDILLTHIFNHNTYHNGQLVTMLRSLKVENIPGTDFVAWSRLQAQ